MDDLSSSPAGCMLCFEEEAPIARAAAQTAGLTLALIERHRFPDGELRLRLPDALPARVVIWRTLDRPNEKLVELLLTAQTARGLGAKHLTLVAPYLAYMRQDIAFHPGEAVSQRIVGRFLASLFDAVITMDPHLHRVATLQEAVPLQDAVVLSGAPLLAELVNRHHAKPLLLGPDEESLQWVAAAAKPYGWEHAACRKVRHGDRHVEVALPDGLDVQGCVVVLMDDVASSGHTLAQATKKLRAAGAASIDVAVTHALFAKDALHLIRVAGVGEVWSTDCIAHATNAVTIVPLVAQTLLKLAGGVPVAA